MAVHKINDLRTTTVMADKAGDTWIVTKSGNIQTMTAGIRADGPAEDRTVIVQGHVFGETHGITFGDMSPKGAGTIEIGKGGSVGSGDTAILSRARGQDIVNDGKIWSNLDGIVSLGKQFSLVNDGKIDVANGGVSFEEGDGRVVNNGKIFGESGVYSTAAAGSITVVNHGLIDTTKTSIDLQGDFGAVIVNTGTITAGVSTGGGRDRFVNDGGKVSGTVDLDDGNDTYVVDRSDILIDEAGNIGRDTVKSSADFIIGEGIEKLVLTGSANIDGTAGSDDNRMFGNGGNNRLDGGGGDDMLRGKGGNDIFVFSYHGGSDEILDFKSGQDRIDMRGWDGYGIENFQDVKQFATQMGKDLLISDGGSDDLLIHDFDKSDLDKHDFIF